MWKMYWSWEGQEEADTEIPEGNRMTLQKPYIK